MPRKHLYQLTLREANESLAGAMPYIGLMFGKPSSPYSYTKIPGFMNVPCNFDVSELKDYVKANIA